MERAPFFFAGRHSALVEAAKKEEPPLLQLWERLPITNDATTHKGAVLQS